MGTITTGIGLISGIDTASLIDSLINLESRGKFRLQDRIVSLRAQQTALLDINARLLNFSNAIKTMRSDAVFRSTLATSSDELILTATTGKGTLPGIYKFIINSLVQNSQKLSQGFTSTNSTPLGLTSINFEFGRGSLAPTRQLETLNGGNGINRGKIIITDGDGNKATIDLTDVTTLNEIFDRINNADGINVTASAKGDGLIITDNTISGTATLKVENAGSDTTATDLGIAAIDGGAGDIDVTVNGVIQGASINTIGLNTPLSSLNDGNGVLILNNVADFKINPKDGSPAINIDLGRINAPITDSTLLSDLNDGKGISINDKDTDPDIRFIAKSSALDFSVDLTGAITVGDMRGRIATQTGGNITINIINGDHFQVENHNAGGAALEILGAGPDGTKTAVDLGILDESQGNTGQTFEGNMIVNLAKEPRARTIQDVIDRINDDDENLGKITASLSSDGVSLLITDNTGGGGTLQILESTTNAFAVHELGISTPGTGGTTRDGDRLIAALDSVFVANINGGNGLTVTGTATLAGTTALSDLLQGAGITTNGNASSPDIFIQDRDGLTYSVEVDGLTTVQDLIDAFNTATGGVVTLSINGQSLRAENFSVGASNFQITDLNGASVATELGIVGDLDNLSGEIIDGVDTQPQGPVLGDSITLTDRNGNSVTVGSLDTFDSLSQIIDAINTQAAAAGPAVLITVGLNATGNGLMITDTSGGTSNLIVTGTAANSLGIDTVAGGVASNEVIGTNLQLQYVSEGTALSELNYGRGVGTGSIKITDGLGKSATINIGSDAVTLFDVIKEINALTSAQDLKVNTRINDNGDGIIIESTYLPADSPFIPIKVEAAGGTTAADLNILGESATIDNAKIDGSYERSVTLDITDTLDDVVQKITDAKIPVNATVLNTGSFTIPFRLSLSSDIAGQRGELLVDTVGADLGFTTLIKGADAKIFFGADKPEDGFLITSSSNTVKNIVPGLTLDLLKTSSSPVTVNVTRDIDAVVDAVSNFVSTFNDVIGRIDQFDFFNVDSEERGILLGNSTTSQVRNLMFSTLGRRVESVSTQFQFAGQVGITVGSGGQITFDQQKFKDAYANDRVAVENLFLALESTTETEREVAPGVTVPETTTTTTSRGLAAIFSDLLDLFIDPITGIVTRADKGFSARIDNFTSRVEELDERLLVRRARLQAQFLAMELALARLQGQNNALFSLTSNVALAL